MTGSVYRLSAVLVCIACGSLWAQPDKPVLPRVLIIGDSVYQHARGVAKELKGQAHVQMVKWPQAVLPSSTNAIKHVDFFLGLTDAAGKPVPEDKQPTWDLIHFNVGLGDLIYCVADIKSHRVQPHSAGGVIRTSPEQYEENLETLLRLFKEKAPKAKLVWASTTPIRHSRENLFKLGTEIEYNQIAERVMKAHGVPITDMYGYAKSHMNMDKPAGHGFDPFHFDKTQLHPPVVDMIVSELGLNPIKRESQEP